MSLSPNETYNILIAKFQQFATAHEMINAFSHGQIDLADLAKDPTSRYPLMHVVPEGFGYQVRDTEGNYRQMRFRIIFFDCPQSKEDKAGNQREIISDCDQLQRDLLAIIQKGDLFGKNIDIVDAGEGIPFMEEYANVLTGVENTITLGFGWTLDACDVPGDFDFIPPGTIADVSAGSRIQHNDLRGLQGGQADQYYHLTLAQYNNLGGGGDTSIIIGDTAYWVAHSADVIALKTIAFNSETLLSKLGDGVSAYSVLEFTRAVQVHEQSATLAVENLVYAHGQLVVEEDTGRMKIGDGVTAYSSLLFIVRDSNITITDVTTNNATTAKHGFLKKLSNVATEYMNGLGNWVTIAVADVSGLVTALAAKVTGNVAITGATKTKITYDSKGLVTSGTDATTADIADSSNKRYVTDAQITVIGNTSGTNTGDQTLTDILTATITDGVTNRAPDSNAVFDALALKAPLASPTFTGTPAAPTPARGDNSTKLATTAYLDRKILGSTVTDSSITGSTAETKLFSILIPAGTLAAGDIVEAVCRWRKINAASGTHSPRMRFGTADNLTGTVIALGTSTATLLYQQIKRLLIVKDSTHIEMFNTGQVTPEDNVTGTSAVTSVTVNLAVDNYLVFSSQLSNGSDTGTLSAAIAQIVTR